MGEGKKGIDNEDVYAEKYKNSRRFYFPFYLMIVILVGIVGYIKYSGLPVNLIAFQGAIAFSVLTILATELHRLGQSYYVTPHFVVHKKGYFKRDIKKVAISSISDVDTKQSAWQRMMGYGNVVVHQFSEGGVVTIRNINNPEHFVNLIVKQIERAKKRSRAE